MVVPLQKLREVESIDFEMHFDVTSKEFQKVKMFKGSKSHDEIGETAFTTIKVPKRVFEESKQSAVQKLQAALSGPQSR